MMGMDGWAVWRKQDSRTYNRMSAIEGNMNKPAYVLFVITLLASCSGGKPQVDKAIENGIEVVLNHVKPYRIPNELSVLGLEKEFVIDAEDPELLKAGLTDIYRFGADSEGSIYIAQRPRKDALVFFRFDDRGQFLKSFGRFGQGPGEIERCSYFGINARDEIFSLDAQKNKITTYSPSGEVLKETLLPPTFIGAIPLDNGNFLAPENQASPDSGFEEMTFNLLDRQYAKIKAMCRFRYPAQYPETGKKANAFLPSPTGIFTSDRIYLGIPGSDYEILAFDLEGTLLKKIRKEYLPVEVTASFQKEALADLPRGKELAERLFFPANKPAYQYLFADETGRLFVMTSEKDEASGQNVCDIFSASGVFIGRSAVGYFDRLRFFWEGVSLDVVAKNKRMYLLHEKDNGYKELAVYKAIWR